MSLALLSLVVVWRAKQARRSAIGWVALLWVLGYAAAFVFSIVGIELLVRLASLEYLQSETFLSVAATAIVLVGMLLGTLPALVGSGRPRPAPLNRT